jgi:tRNA modification GTPase
VVTWFAGPRSYTGEDVVEIAAHGSPVLLEYSVRKAVLCGGARLAEPGEFTQRAFLAGRIDLTQAEAVDDLIGRARWSRRGWRRGRWVGLYRGRFPVKEMLVGLIAAMEAGIDFAEDDIDVMGAERIAATIAEVRGRWRSWSGALRMGGWCGRGSGWRLWGGRMRGSRACSTGWWSGSGRL